MTETTSSCVRFETGGSIARVTLDRPAQHNALRAVDVSALHEAFDSIERDSACRVLVLTGSGERTFCAGAALDEMESGAMSGRVFDRLTGRLERLVVPTVCALNGSVYGGGAELALCCDFRIGTPHTRLSVPAARLGVSYPPGGLGRYVRRVGLPAASRIFLAAEELDAEDLFRVGYLTHVVERTDLPSETLRLAGHLADLAPLAVRAMKRVMREIADGTLDPAEAERLATEVAASADLREGLRAARERRDPRFEGR
jgi:enoyl-CoA hydratase/carnithine racemase